MRVGDLIAEHSLQLRLHTPSGSNRLAHEVTGCAPTELMDPTAYLDPGSVLLTQGIAMNVTEDRTWDAYVERLTRVPISALAFSTGVAHRVLPPGLITACTAHDVPLLEVPPVVPPLQVDRHIEQVLNAEKHSVVTRGWALADDCARLANQGADITTLLATVFDAIGDPLAVYDAFGSVIAQYPALASWPVGPAKKPRRGMLRIALPMGLNNPCHLAVLHGSDKSMLDSLLGPVASIIALQLNRSVVVDASRHQEIKHFVSVCGSWSETTSHDIAAAFRALSLNREEKTTVLVADMSREFAALSWQFRVALHESFHEVRVTELDERLYAFAQLPRSGNELLLDRFTRLSPHQPLVLTHAVQTLDELRLAVVHAQDLVTHIATPTLAPTLGLAAIVSAAAGRGARESADRFFAPIIAHDERRASQLMLTLQTYIQHNAMSAPTCEALFIHRNSLTYRLRKIETLLDTRLETIEGQATCLMALRLVGMATY
jgi:purine catabolism regulator